MQIPKPLCTVICAIITSVLLLSMVWQPAKADEQKPVEQGAGAALVYLCYLAGLSSDHPKVQGALEALKRQQATNKTLMLKDVLRCANGAGLDLVLEHSLVENLKHPGLIYEDELKRFAVLMDHTDRYASLWVEGMNTLMEKEAAVPQQTVDVVTFPASAWLQFEAPIVMTDHIGERSQVTAKYNFTNTGQRPITVRVETTSCGCTVADLPKQRLKPGEKGEVTLISKADGWQAKTVTATLLTDDPRWPRRIVSLQTVLPKRAILNLHQLAMRTREGEGQTLPVELLLPSGSAIKEITSRKPHFTAKVVRSEEIEGGRVHHIEVSIDAAAPAGAINNEMRFDIHNATTTIKAPVLRVTGEVISDIFAEPKQLFLGQLATDFQIKKTLHIKSYSKRDFAIDTIKSDDDLLSATGPLKVMAASHEIEVSATIKGPLNSLWDKALVITLTNGNKIRVPIQAIVAAQGVVRK